MLGLVCLYLLVSVANAHSWVQCADYKVADAKNWDVSQCKGYARNYGTAFQWANYVFGADVGYNYIPTENKPCRDPLAADSYSTTYPAASYAIGQKVCLAWPAKNHVAASCTNQYIPDHGVKVYRSERNSTTDPTMSGFRKNLVADLGAASGENGKGFQNCPLFCENPDKAFCEGCFTVPKIDPGKYTFIWVWAFNSDALSDTTY